MRLRTIAAGICWILTIAWMVFIFLMSAQPAEESSTVSGGITEMIVSIITPGFEGLSEAEQQALVEAWHEPVRKLAHLTEYAILGCLLTASLYLTGIPMKASALSSVGISLLYAVSDELHQSVVEELGPGVGDVFIDLAGAVIGVAALVVLYLLIRRIYRKRNYKKIP